MSKIAETLSPQVYGGLPGFKAEGTSRDAAVAAAGDSVLLRERVYTAIKSAGAGGMTADEAAKVMGRTVLSVRPRVTELAQTNRIEDTGQRRANDSGRKANAWRAKP